MRASLVQRSCRSEMTSWGRVLPRGVGSGFRDALPSKIVPTISTGNDAPRMDFVFTVCDNAANEKCPYWPGQPMTAHWGIPDPAAVKGPPEIIERAFNDAFSILDRRISLFLALPLSTLESLAIQKEIDTIGRQ